MLKRSGLSRSQWVFLLAGSVLILLSPLVLLVWSATAAIICAVALTACFIGFLVLESRHYQAILFEELLAESRRQYGQVDALLSIHRTLNGGMPLPPSRGWAISPDLTREVVRIVLRERPEVVLEVSSGTSTLIMAYMLERNGTGHVYSLEHDAYYAERTRQYLREHGLEHRATVIVAPLVDHELAGSTVRWYDLSQLELPGTIDLMLVDGPPDTTGPLARYPAVPLLHSRFSATTTVILDDGARADETETARRWGKVAGAVSMENLDVEKGGWVTRYVRSNLRTGNHG